jgi:hypothetical protein
MKKKEIKAIQENTYGGKFRLRQDIDNSTYLLFQKLEQSDSGELKETFTRNNKSIDIEISYTKTKDKKISRTTADAEILLAALLTQNKFDPTISNITLKDLLFYLNKEYSKQNYERLKMDLKILKTMNRSIIAEETEEEDDHKTPPKSKFRMQSMIIDELHLDSRSRRENYIILSKSFVERVKQKFIIHLPPKEVFFKLNSNEKNVCERLILLLRPRGRGEERDFGLTYLRKSLDDFTTEILGHKYKYTHKKKEVITKVLKNLNFLVKNFSFEKEKSKRRIFILIEFYSYDEYIKKVDEIKKESKYYEEVELFPKEEMLKIEQSKPQIYYDLLDSGVSEAKLKWIFEKEFEIIKENKNQVIQEYQEKELSFIDYLKAKYYVARLYSDREKNKGATVNFEAIFLTAIQTNWSNIKSEEKQKEQKSLNERIEKQKKIKELEKRIDIIEQRWDNIIVAEVEAMVEKNPEIVEKVVKKEIEERGEVPMNLSSKNATPLESFRSSHFYKYAIVALVAKSYPKIASIKSNRDNEIAPLEEELNNLK